MVPARHARVHRRAGLRQARLARLRHPRPVLRRLPRAGRPPARRGRATASGSSSRPSTTAASRSARSPSGCAQACLEDADRLRQDPDRVRPADRRQPGRRPSRSPTSPSWSRPRARSPTRPPGSRTSSSAGRRSVAEVKQAAAVCKLYSTEAAVIGDPHRHAGLRRQRLHGGVPRRPVLPRRQDPRDRRGHLARCSAWSSPAAWACPAPDRHRPPHHLTTTEPAPMTDQQQGTSVPGAVRRAHRGRRPAGGRRPGRLNAAHEASAAPPAKAAAKLAAQNKLYVRDRIALLFDEGSFVEDGRYANAIAPGLPADGVVTGRGTVDGRPAIVVANDPTVKAGSWGARTVEKIVRATEMALREELPVFWFVDSAGARITDQVEMFPGGAAPGGSSTTRSRCPARCRRSAACSGPSAAGGAYIPAFTDIVIMVEGNASMYLGSPRDGGDGCGGEGLAGGDGRRADALHRLRLSATCWPRRRRGDRAGQAVLLLPARRAGATRAAVLRAGGAVGAADPQRRAGASRASRSTSTR